MRNELWIFVTKFFNGSNGAGNYSVMLNNNAFFMTVLIYDDNHGDSRCIRGEVAIIFASIYQRVSHASDCSSECHCTLCIKTLRSIGDFNARDYYSHLLMALLKLAEWYSCMELYTYVSTLPIILILCPEVCVSNHRWDHNDHLPTNMRMKNASAPANTLPLFHMENGTILTIFLHFILFTAMHSSPLSCQPRWIEVIFNY